MVSYFSDRFPSIYRLDLNEKISTLIKQGRPFNLIGMPAVGKNTYINFYTRIHKEYLKDEINRNFIPFDARIFFGNNLQEFKNLIDQIILKEVKKETETIVFMKHVDELSEALIDPILKLINSLREPPYNIKFIFISHRPLSEKTNNDILISRLFGSEVYFTPCDLRNFNYELTVFEEQLDIQLTKSQKEQLYDLTGGVKCLHKNNSHLREYRKTCR